MESDETRAFATATEAILKRLARDGAQRTSTIKEWAKDQSVDGDEWFQWAHQAGLLEQIYGNGPDDPMARWALSVERVMSYALEEAAKRARSD